MPWASLGLSLVVFGLAPPLRSLPPPLLPARARGTSASRLSVCLRLSDEEEAAKRAWLAKREEQAGQSAEPRSMDVDASIAAAQRERTEARERMMSSMGGSSDALRRHAGAAFGFGGEDEEDYGFGPRKRREPDEEVDLLTGRPLRDLDVSRGNGFGGRTQGWSRRVEAISPNPPPVPDTLREPGAGVPVQSFMYDHFGEAHAQSQPEEADREDENALFRQEDDLLQALRGSLGEE